MKAPSIALKPLKSMIMISHLSQTALSFLIRCMISPSIRRGSILEWAKIRVNLPVIPSNGGGSIRGVCCTLRPRRSCFLQMVAEATQLDIIFLRRTCKNSSMRLGLKFGWHIILPIRQNGIRLNTESFPILHAPYKGSFWKVMLLSKTSLKRQRPQPAWRSRHISSRKPMKPGGNTPRISKKRCESYLMNI